jgi:hypothetical protein
VAWRSESKRSIAILLLAALLGILIGAIAAGQLRFHLPHLQGEELGIRAELGL